MARADALGSLSNSYDFSFHKLFVRSIVINVIPSFSNAEIKATHAGNHTRVFLQSAQIVRV